MPVTISLEQTTTDRATARIGATHLADFEPAALLVDQPLFAQRPMPADPVAYGQRLWAALGGAALQTALADLPRAPNLAGLVAIRSTDPHLQAIPWEYLHDGSDFLIFRILLVREVPDAPHPAPPDPAQPWRLVSMGSDPLLQAVRDPETKLLTGYAPLPRLQVVRELETLRETLLRQTPPVPLRWQRIAPTAAALTDDLLPIEPVLFHYTGHGDVVDGQPLLCFDDGTGCMDPRPVPDLAANLRDMVYLAFLNACRTADSREPGANLALALVQNGIPVVLGTQYQVLDAAANIFAQTFYRFLLAGQHPAQALYRARLQLKNQFRSAPREWAVPLLYLAADYAWPTQQPDRGIALEPIEPPLPHTEALRAPATIFGRDVELMELARAFLVDQQRIVTIRGTGGIGKTALVNALAGRLRFSFPNGIYALTLALAGSDAHLSAAAVRRTLADRLEVQDPAFDDPAAALRQEEVLVRQLRSRPQMLLIWDNYETVLWRLGREAADLDAPPDIDAEQRAEAEAVQRLVRSLADAGAYLLFTSRQSPVGLPGEQSYPTVERGHQLGGLDPRSSLQLLRANAGPRVPSTPFLEQLAAAVGHSPLALQLAAARWAQGQQDEAGFLANLQAELQQQRDPGQPFHRQSVLVNVRLSLDALPAELRQSLLLLSIVANPLILPLHGAVVWGLEDEEQWFTEPAHTRLEALHQASLLQGQGYAAERNRAQLYSLQPVIAGVLQQIVQEEQVDLAAARARYAAWADQLVSRAYGEGGIDYSAEVARATQAILPDLPAALPGLPAERRGWAAWRAATIFRQFGRPDQAQQMLELAESTAQEIETDELLSRVHHEQATALVTRGDLAGAMALYEQSLAIKDGLGDVRGKSATLVMLAQLQFARGDQDVALGNARTSLQLLQAMGATPDAAQVAQIIQQMEAARSGGAATGPDDRSPARLVGALVAATVRALRGQLPRESVQAELHRLAARDDLQPVVAALQAALDNRPTAAANLPATAEALLAQGTPAERADALMGIGNLAAQLGDPATELQTRRQAVAALRQAGEDRETLVALSIALHNLAIAYINQDDPVVAIPLLEEVVLMLDGQNAHPDLEQDRSLLEALRRRAAGEAEPGLRDAVAAWVEAGRDEEQFAGLLNAICNLYVTAVHEGDPARRTALADALEHVCAARPLPIPGAHDFLQLLQLLLHADPTTTDEAARLRAALPTALAQALATMEGLISGEADTASPEAAEPEAMEEELAAAAQAMLGQLSPEQQAELAVVSQVWALLEQVFPLLRDPDVTVTERARHAEGLERAADQFAAGADAGSPRLVAAETLQRVAGWLRGTPPDPDALPQPYRNLIKRLI